VAGDVTVFQIPDPDPCAKAVFWSSISAASDEATLAGLLAGLLIAAAAALIVQWYQGAAPPTIALFGSGVPALMLSTYLFVVIAGLDIPKDTDYRSNLCNQLWSQWVLAIGLLFVGTAVLVCGLGWALVNYAENLAADYCKTNWPITMVAVRRDFLIRLNAWLSSSIIISAIVLLTLTNVTYLKAIDQENLNSEIFGERWYLLFFVFLFGVYFIGRSSYVVLIRTLSARRANKASCVAYAAGGPPVATHDEGIRAVAASEFVLVMCVALSAFLAAYTTSKTVKDGAVSPTIVIYVVVLYVIVRAIYVLLAGIVKLVSAKKDDTPDNDAVPPANAESSERIRINYSRGRLRVTTYNVVFLAIIGTFFVAVLGLGPLLTYPRIIMSLFLGGFYPAAILTGLSDSVPAAMGVRKPRWERVLSSRGLN
jgi:hypothetical protein